MMKTKIALAVLLTIFALAPASAAKSKKATKATSSKAVKAAPKAKKGGKPALVKAVANAAVVQAPAERKSDRWMDTTSQQFLNALWKLDPEAAIGSGKFDGAANLTIPNAATRAKELAFTDEWLQRLGKMDARQLSN
ncbi:MAG: hypothetical protein JWR56_571, partial [Massilia sp.]|nr:hypothetical protein [Massilia sp.]